MRWFWDAAAALDPAARRAGRGTPLPVCRPSRSRELLRGAGLATVETSAIDVPTVFRDFDDYWSPFLGGQGPAPGYCVALPVERDGRIALLARAWAVRGAEPQS